ncbi:MAG: hypothetical protein D3909_02875 [Candidatus Electrothrix sp. ATG1]|nr:hypothetical protein [Candidatus Electrothrix sp. ATG1]MCI5210440.1 hypothetical protein [Candidatus Electrothrix sp. ATG2]
MLVSCAPTQSGKHKKVTGPRSIGHDLEIFLRGDAEKSPLAFLIKKEMDRYDREQVNHVFERGLSGRTSSWTNPDKGNQYRITPLPAYQTIGKSICRKATVEAMLNADEQLQTNNIKACRAKNGQWRLSEVK